MKHLLVDYKLVFDLKLRPNFCDFMQTSDPVGAIVLERCQVLKDSPTQKKHGFTIGKLFLPLYVRQGMKLCIFTQSFGV